MQWLRIGAMGAAAMVLPAAAEADCAARIAALEGSPAMTGDGLSDGAIREDGGATTHQDGGPAVPQDSWFTDADKEDASSALTHLDAARQARAAGDEQSCLDAVGQAEAALRSD